MEQSGSGDHFDVTLVCEGEQFRTNRSRLRSASPYFVGMFESGMKEAVAGQVVLPNVSASAMKTILSWVHAGKLPSVSKNDVDKLQDLLQATDFLQMHFLFNYIMFKYCDRLSLEHVLEQLVISDLYDHAEAVKCFRNSVAVNFGHLVDHESLAHLTAVQLKRILKEPHLRVGCGDHVIGGILKWVKHDVEERRVELEEMMGLVEVRNVTTDFLDSILDDPLVQSSVEVYAHLSSKAAARRKEPPARTRVLSFELGDRSYLTVYEVQPNETGPTLTSRRGRTEMPFGVHASRSLVAYDNHVLVIGGQGHEREILRYNPDTSERLVVGNLKCPVVGGGAGVLGGLVYVVGGRVANQLASNKVQRFNPASGECEELAETASGCERPVVSTFGNKLYVISASSTLGKVEEYDTLLNQWTIVTSDSESEWDLFAMCGHRVVVSVRQSRLMNAWSFVLVYDFNEGEWESSGDRGQRCLSGMWSVRLNGTSSSPVLLVRDEDNLYTYDPDEGVFRNVAYNKTSRDDSEIQVLVLDG